jgi:hypothetical protein
MSPLEALVYSFFFGLLHGVLPDEHTWPITLSYALGTARGREGMKAGLYFSLAFTFQRMALSEVSYLALAPFLLDPAINGIVYMIVGGAMTVAGAVVLRRRRYPHLHLIGHHHADGEKPAAARSLFGRVHVEREEAALPLRWTLVHGFIAGFGIGGFALFVNTVAAPAMGSPWVAMLPGLAFGLGTAIMLVLIGGLFGRSLHLFRWMTPAQIRNIGTEVGARTLFFGGLFFAALGAAMRLGLLAWVPEKDLGYLTIALFMMVIVIPALVFSIRRARVESRGSGGAA